MVQRSEFRRRSGKQLATVISLVILMCSDFAFAGALERSRFTVVSNGKRYTCSRIKSPPIPIFKRNGKFMKGADALKDLTKALRRSRKLNTKSGKKQIKSFKAHMAAAKIACAHADSPTLPATLAKLTRALTRSDIQYFLDKAGFGLSSIEEPMVTIGLNGGIDALVAEFMRQHDEDPALMPRVLNQRDGSQSTDTTQTPAGQRQAILDLLIHTRNPYQEKLALFLLSVWTTAGDVISDETFRGAWWDYYERLRASAASNETLPTLGIALTRDPLMLVYLSNALNLNISPNENYARELMELFTLGTTDSDGNANYTETQPDGSGDIAVAARMLTGWRVNLNYSTNKLVALYQSNRHSNGPHTMFAGKSYSFTGENDADLINGIFAHHPQARNYYAREILKAYLTPNPPAELVTALGQVLADNDYRLRDALIVLFSSQAFFDSRFKDTVPMNSLEYAVKCARLLGLFGAVNVSTAEYQLRNMGMQVNMAPSVFWYSPTTWTSASVALERANYLAEILSDSTAQSAPEPDWTIASLLPSGSATPLQVIQKASGILGITALSATQIGNIEGYFNQRLDYTGSYHTVPYVNTNADHQSIKGRGGYYLLMISPEFQLL